MIWYFQLQIKLERALLPGITVGSVCLRRTSSERIYGSAISQARGVIKGREGWKRERGER
jgi:hypothetical protein